MNCLIIPDLQIPFENKKALPFCVYLKRHFQVADENCFCLGDETDQYFAGLYKRSPDALLTPSGEIAAAQYRLGEWYAAFPKMKVNISNHASRWAKKAFEAEIPQQVMKPYRELIKAPDGWIWNKVWTSDTRKPFKTIHGMGYSGAIAHRTAALDAGCSLAMGHLHSHAGVSIIKTEIQEIWGANGGCLIDPDAYAFEYGRDSRFKPTLGALVVLGNGKSPWWIPLL